MSWLNIWKPIYINRSNRPILDDGEYTEYIRDYIGLYQGKSKVLNRQNGRIYLTNQRLIYFDNENSANSLAMDLKLVSSIELIDGFLRSLPKIKLFFKDLALEQSQSVAKQVSITTWICKICSFKNKLEIGDGNDLPTCQSCGIKAHKSVFADASPDSNTNLNLSVNTNASVNQCPTCTFINHPSMKHCEICGAELNNLVSGKSLDSPKLNIVLENDQEVYSSTTPYIKLSFRKGGEGKFMQHLTKILDDIKWQTLQNNGKINQNSIKINQPEIIKENFPGGGIRGLELLSEQQRQSNENILSNSLNDLENLMFKYKDLIKLTQNFTKNNPRLTTITSLVNIDKKSSLYLPELARDISEYTLNLFTSQSSMITSQDLFALYNRYLINSQGFGIELVTSPDFLQAINLFPLLQLPILPKRYENSGLLVLTHSNIQSYQNYILDYLRQTYYQYIYQKLKLEIIEDTIGHTTYFRGNTISEMSDHFHWAYNITIEEIEKCVANGSIIIDHHISGTFYFLNIFDTDNYQVNEDEIKQKVLQDISREQHQIETTIDNFDSQLNLQFDKNLDLTPTPPLNQTLIDLRNDNESVSNSYNSI